MQEPEIDSGVSGFTERLGAVRQRIREAGGDPEQIRLVAVTKGHGPGAARAAVTAGISDIGENYALELLEKAAVVEGARWHFVGRLQRNKVRKIAAWVSLFESVDRPELGDEIARWSPGARVLVQVAIDPDPGSTANGQGLGPEAGRGGCLPENATSLVEYLVRLGLRVDGLMGVGPPGLPELARAGFQRLRRMADEMGLGELSIGMSDDLEVAVAEGSTMLRLGRALFGERQASSHHRVQPTQ